jgi:cardiolipin synthase A/B
VPESPGITRRAGNCFVVARRRRAEGTAIIDRLQARGGADEPLQRHLSDEQAINTDSPFVPGNKLTLLRNGPATYAAMFAAIRTAKDHVNLETYIFGDDEAGAKFADLLLERQAAGVQVNLIYDSIGSVDTPQTFFDRLRDTGVRVLEFNPVNPLKVGKKAWRLNNRDHRKSMIVDGHIAFTGGINISATYSSAPSAGRGARHGNAVDPEAGWRDTHIGIEGPAVAEFQRLFMTSWASQEGEVLPARNYFPDVEAQGKASVRAVAGAPDIGHSGIYRTLMSAIADADSKVLLTIAYFAPDPQLLQALIEAAQRGVDVALVVPSVSDSAPVFYLGRSYYTKLLQGGVKIHERRGAVMHAKTASIDGVWSTIGSTNLDWRSFLLNYEINAVILDRSFGAQMEAMFAEDLAESDPVTLAQWAHRPFVERVKERCSRIGKRWL